ncbi:SURF1 family protein [Streptomyces sp. 21So2-11]|uniref:SURF1 family protein n=1 Tax=Streptomyces sp. 21So2-11 TaxID=3144408 RepID=UPI003219BCE6
MYRFLLTPRWWGLHLFVVLAIPFCVLMGSWQLGRFEDRVASHQAQDAKPDPGKQAAVPLGELLPVDTETSGRHTTATGRYAEQFVVPGRKLDKKSGSYVLTLLRTDGGKSLPVVRGWMPPGAKAPAPPTGEVTVSGALQASENAGTDGVNAEGGLPAGQVGVISAATLLNLVPAEVEMYDAWITLDDGEAGLRPVPAVAPQGSGLDLKAFQNLGYTGEWFVFAGFVVFMWFRLVRREAEAVRDLALGILPEETTAETTAEATAETGADTSKESVESGSKTV